jgi:hypothetical protein
MTPAKHEGTTSRTGSPRALFDPRRLAVRADGTKGPVDKGNELAADMDAGLTEEENANDRH